MFNATVKATLTVPKLKNNKNSWLFRLPRAFVVQWYKLLYITVHFRTWIFPDTHTSLGCRRPIHIDKILDMTGSWIENTYMHL